MKPRGNQLVFPENQKFLVNASQLKSGLDRWAMMRHNAFGPLGRRLNVELEESHIKILDPIGNKLMVTAISCYSLRGS